jgi:hypothetical protein
MALRFPRGFGGAGAGRNGWDVLQAELVQEKIANMARMGRRLEDALEALRAFDRERPGGAAPAAEDAAARERLVARAGEALWHFVVQREACGLRDADEVVRQMGVPREVRLRMGPAPRRAR